LDASRSGNFRIAAPPCISLILSFGVDFAYIVIVVGKRDMQTYWADEFVVEGVRQTLAVLRASTISLLQVALVSLYLLH